MRRTQEIPKWQVELIEGLRSAMRERGHSQDKAARLIKVQQPTINMWVNYKAIPNRESENKIRCYINEGH